MNPLDLHPIRMTGRLHESRNEGDFVPLESMPRVRRAVIVRWKKGSCGHSQIKDSPLLSTKLIYRGVLRNVHCNIIQLSFNATVAI